MDLSSLEGPPLLEHSLARDPPSVHLAALPSLGLPPRPASADAVSRIYALQSQPQSQAQSQSQYRYQAPSHGYSRSQSHLVPYPHIPSSHPDDHNLPPHYRRARTPSPTPISWSSSSPSPDASQRHRPRAPSPQRLVWLDAEKSWVLVSDAQTSVYTPAYHGCNCGAGTGAGAGTGRESSLNISGSGNGSRNPPSRNRNRNRNATPNLMPPTMNINMNIDPAADLYPPPSVDAPPPYESHVFDKPLVQVQVQAPGGSPRRRGASMQSEFGIDSASGSGSEGEPPRGRTGGSGSRWTAVARRLRASPVR